MDEVIDIYPVGKPDEVYFHNPTPKGDIFTYSLDGGGNGDPTVTRISYWNSKVIEQNTVREVVAMQDCKNERDLNLECTFNLRQTRSNTVSTSWSSNFGFRVEGEVGFDIKIFETKSKLTGDFHWERSETHEEKTEIGTDISAKTIVGPGQAARAFLTAERGTLKVAVDYAATIAGSSYLSSYYGNEFVPSRDLLYLNFGDADYFLQATQIVDITVFTKAEIVVKNLNTNKLISVFK